MLLLLAASAAIAAAGPLGKTVTLRGGVVMYVRTRSFCNVLLPQPKLHGTCFLPMLFCAYVRGAQLMLADT